MRTPFCAWFILCASLAYAQDKVAGGTIVIYEFTNDEFVVAADSRSTIPGQAPDDTSCKITAFRSHHVVFMGYGHVSMTIQGKEWDASSDATTTVLNMSSEQLKDPTKYLDVLADLWSIRAMSAWMFLQQKRPDILNQILEQSGGFLTGGAFAMAYQGKINLAEKMIGFANGKIGNASRENTNHCFNQPCAYGRDDIFNKYIHSKTNYMVATPKELKTYGDPLLRAERLAELTAAQDKSGKVHGPIDALSLKNDGTINWYRRKPNCPLTSD